MSSLSEQLWNLNSLDSLKNDAMKSADVEHAFLALSSNVQTAQLPEAEGKNWKLIIDPVIKGKGHTKVIRYGGTLDGPDEKPAVVKDPRFGSIMRQKEIDLKMPKFKYDKWSVGSPPMKSIFIYGLNDNVNQEFLTGLFQPLGSIDQLKVYYHPKTRKHLGIAFVSFSKSSVTKEVLAKFHGTSIMGNTVNIKPDPLCQITKKVLDKLIKAPGLVINIPEIIQSVELRSQHKTAAYAFRHNERSQNYYTARGKVRKPSDLSDQTKPDLLRRDSLTQEEPESHDSVPVQHNLKLEQVSPKIDTPPDTEISPIHPEEDIMAAQPPESLPPKPVKRERSLDRDSTVMTPELKYKVAKTEMMSPSDRHDERRRDARLYEMDRDRRKAHSERKWEEYKMRTEMQIRAEKTSRYVKEHCSGSSSRTGDKYVEEKYLADKYAEEKYGSDKYSKDKYSKDYHHLSERERYYAYYDKYYRDKDRASDHRYMDDKHRSKYDKYDKYAMDKYKYYDYHRHSDHKPRSSSKELEKYHKLSKSVKDYENVYHRESPRVDHVVALQELDKHRHLATSDPERSKSRSRPREEPHLVDRISKRKRSKSPIYHHSPISVPEPKKASPKIKMENSGSATSHDTGYHSISPLPISPPAPKPEIPQDISQLSENPYGCGRAVPRKNISKVKVIGMRSAGPSDDMSSSSMSLDEESGGEEEESPAVKEEMTLEDISPNTTPQQPAEQNTLPLQPPIPLLPVPTAALLPLPGVPPVQYQTGQWLHTTFPDMYQYGYESYNPEEAADILAHREAEEKAAAKRIEQIRNRERKSKSLDMLLSLMESILKKDVKIILNEKTAFTKLEEVWNQEEDKKKKEEEELAAKRKAEMANNTDPLSSQAPDMPSLSEMRSMSDAKQSSHIRQANLSFKVPKLNRGMRPQVIVKKMQLPKKLDSAEEMSDDDVNDLDLVIKRRQVGNRYNKIYSSSSSSSESEEEEEEEEVEEVAEKKVEVELEPKDEVKLPSVAPPKYKSRVEEEEILVLEQIFREELTEEDKTFFKTAYDQILGDYPDLLDGITWFSAPEIPSSARRRQPSSVDMRHSTGCARTEGFYRMTKQEKMALKSSFNRTLSEPVTPGVQPPQPPAKKVDGRTTARSTRAMQRRQATHYLTVPEIQFMQLTTRRKQVKFMRSDIHDWGLFAQEPIIADEMVIEYVGEVVREIIANIRERGYEKEGIGSSYLFRIDQSSYIVDATHKGSISRFINHNCDPNCYARVISVGTKKKIVIYSKRDIDTNEEITYDYKFAIEEEANKIPCLCKSPLCRGFLN
ncbi:hypothetical protein ACHWQZ_G012141 [Mnemiopsis leidyi]